MIAYDIFYNWVKFTSGASVIYAIPRPTIFNITFDSASKYFILVLITTVLCVFICWRLSHSPFGNLLRAIKDDDIAVQASGRSPLVFKIKALVISGILAAIVGVLYSGYLSIFVPGAYDVDLSISIVAMVIVGGSGNIWGASWGSSFSDPASADQFFELADHDYRPPPAVVLRGLVNCFHATST